MNKYKTLKSIIPYIATLILLACMTVTAEIFNEKEIIFPEITALAIGYIVAEKRSWQVNGRRMLALITVCAIVGVLIVRYIKIGIFPQVILAFTVSQIIFMFSRTTFAPLISAIVLPVMMQTTSFIYPISAFLLTLLVILFNKLLIKIGVKNKEKYIPTTINFQNDAIDTIIRVACVLVIGYVSFLVDFRYAIAPPLLVIFTEFSRPTNKVRNHPIKPIIVLTGCAFVGAFSRYILSITLNLPLTISALTATLIMLIILRCTKLFMPPVGAITILSMIIPESCVFTYPLQIFAGSVIIVFLSRILFMSRQNKHFTKI